MQHLRLSFLAGLALLLSSWPLACQPHRHAHYYLYFEEAIDAFYRPPRQPQKALDILKEACQKFPAERDLSCFNYGILLEVQNQPRAARQAYAAAYSIKPDPLYREAERRSGGSIHYRGQRAEAYRLILSDCAQVDYNRALSRARQADLSRPVLASSPLKECLSKAQGYTDLLATARADERNLGQISRDLTGQKDPYRTVWDTRSAGNHPVTVAWQSYLRERNQSSLSRFFQSLDQAAGSDPVEQARALGFKRAAALLISRGALSGRGLDPLLRPYL